MSDRDLGPAAGGSTRASAPAPPLAGNNGHTRASISPRLSLHRALDGLGRLDPNAFAKLEAELASPAAGDVLLMREAAWSAVRARAESRWEVRLTGRVGTHPMVLLGPRR